MSTIKASQTTSAVFLLPKHRTEKLKTQQNTNVPNLGLDSSVCTVSPSWVWLEHLKVCGCHQTPHHSELRHTLLKERTICETAESPSRWANQYTTNTSDASSRTHVSISPSVPDWDSISFLTACGHWTLRLSGYWHLTDTARCWTSQQCTQPEASTHTTTPSPQQHREGKHHSSAASVA